MKQEYIEIIKELSKCFGIEQSLSQSYEEAKLEYKRLLFEQKEQVKLLYDELRTNGDDKEFIEFLDGEYGDESDLYLLLVNYMYEITNDVKFQMKYMQKHLDEGIKRDDDLFLLMNLDFQVRAYAFAENMKISFQKQWDINKYLGERLKQELNFCVDRIAKNDRNEDIVVVVTSQLLSQKHGPTVVTLEYCRLLKKMLNKEVLLVNIALKLEIQKLVNIGCSYVNKMNYCEELSGNKKIRYKDDDILIYQMQLGESNMHELLDIMEMIKALKPICIWNMATIPAVMGLTNQITTNVYTHFCQGYAPIMTDVFFNYFRGTNNESIKNREYLEKHSVRIIDSVGFSENKPIKGTVSRKEFDIPKDAFVLGVVGNRLESECTPEFMQVLENALIDNDNIYVLFIGKVSDEFIRDKIKSTNNFSRYIFAGYRRDLEECMNVMDVFVNTLRYGGGGCGINALFLKKPIITVKMGDVYANATDDFAVDGLNEYNSLIKKYCEDKEFYQKQSELAYKKYKELVVNDEKLGKDIEEMLNMLE